MSERIVLKPRLARKGTYESDDAYGLVLTCGAVGEAQRYTPGSTIENAVGTWISDGPADFDMSLLGERQVSCRCLNSKGAQARLTLLVLS